MDQIPIEVFYLGFGALGGIIRTLNWILDNEKKPEDEREKFSFILSLRNVIIGAVVGLFVNTSYVNAFSAGFVGEWIIDKIGKKFADMF